MTPMQRSLALLREQGYTVDIVEHRLPRTPITRDLYGIFDIVAIKAGETGVMGVQTTTRSHAGARRQKMQESGHLSTWLAAENRAVLHSWAKQGPRGERKRWNVKIEEVSP